LRLLEDVLPQQLEAIFTFFRPDAQKDGGTYITVKGKLKRIDPISQNILLADGTVIQLDNLLQVESEIWDRY